MGVIDWLDVRLGPGSGGSVAVAEIDTQHETNDEDDGDDDTYFVSVSVYGSDTEDDLM